MKRYFLVLISVIQLRSALGAGRRATNFSFGTERALGCQSERRHFYLRIFCHRVIFLIKDADINVNVVPTTLFHTFGIGGRFAQAMVMINPGSANGQCVPDSPGFPAPELNASGFADGFLGFKLGLIGAPALSIADFAKHTPAFSMNGYFRWWYSGTYDSKSPFNLGTNRSTFEIGLPMAIPLGKNPKRATWLESYPSVRFYTANNDPTIITQADKSQQMPLFLLENHLTHNFTPKFWVGADLRYQYGGELKLDDEKQDNKVNVLGGGIEAGYQIIIVSELQCRIWWNFMGR